MAGRPANPAGRPLRIDAHVHLSTWWPEIRRTGYRSDLDYTVPGLIREMDRNHIDFALTIQLFQAPSDEEALAEGRRIFEESGGRLFPVATVDPTGGEDAVAASVRRIAQEPHLVGVKLFPGYRPFYPHDRRLEPVYELAHRRNLPILVHQGDTLDGVGLLKFARPIEVDEVAARYRDVRFVLCHLGNPWIEEAAEVVYKNPNVYTDTSGLLGPPSSPYFDRALDHCRERVERAVVASGLPDRFLYGSDWPLEELGTATGLIARLALSNPDKTAILGGNAQKLFGLPSKRLPADLGSRTVLANKP
jgi:hypothetical protein